MKNFKNVSVVIPAYNEQKTIKSVIDDIDRNFGLHIGELIVVNDCSIDKTRDIVEKLNIENLVIINNSRNLDYAAREIEVCKNTNIKIAYSCEASYMNKSHSNLSVPRLEISNGSKLKTLTKIFFLKFLKSKLMDPKTTLGRLKFRKIIGQYHHL